jgi:hypothetical protein
VAAEAGPPDGGDRGRAVRIQRPDLGRDDVLGVVEAALGHQRVEAVQHLFDLLPRAGGLLDGPLTFLGRRPVGFGQFAAAADFDLAAFGLADRAFDLLPQLGFALGAERIAARDRLQQQFQFAFRSLGVGAHPVAGLGQVLFDLRPHALLVDLSQVFDVAEEITAGGQQFVQQGAGLVAARISARCGPRILQVDQPQTWIVVASAQILGGLTDRAGLGIVRIALQDGIGHLQSALPVARSQSGSAQLSQAFVAFRQHSRHLGQTRRADGRQTDTAVNARRAHQLGQIVEVFVRGLRLHVPFHLDRPAARFHRHGQTGRIARIERPDQHRVAVAAQRGHATGERLAHGLGQIGRLRPVHRGSGHFGQGQTGLVRRAAFGRIDVHHAAGLIRQRGQQHHIATRADRIAGNGNLLGGQILDQRVHATGVQQTRPTVPVTQINRRARPTGGAGKTVRRAAQALLHVRRAQWHAALQLGQARLQRLAARGDKPLSHRDRVQVHRHQFHAVVRPQAGQHRLQRLQRIVSISPGLAGRRVEQHGDVIPAGRRNLLRRVQAKGEKRLASRAVVGHQVR